MIRLFLVAKLYERYGWVWAYRILAANINSDNENIRTLSKMAIKQKLK